MAYLVGKYFIVTYFFLKFPLYFWTSNILFVAWILVLQLEYFSNWKINPSPLNATQWKKLDWLKMLENLQRP